MRQYETTEKIKHDYGEHRALLNLLREKD
jgi:hypothetical protein